VEKIALSEEKETLLITLYGKAVESGLSDSFLHGTLAADAVRRIDYDFAKFKIRPDDGIALASRAKTLDDCVRRFLASHPDATVINLGCGLDTRVYRVDPPAGVRWFDLDYPEVIALRRRLYPEREGTVLIATPVTEPEWIARLPSDRPAIIVAEGLLPYIPAAEVPPLFQRLVAHLPRGEVAFDGYSRLGLRMLQRSRLIKSTGAVFKWGIDDPRELEQAVPGLRFVGELRPDPAHAGRMSWTRRMLVYAFYAVPAFRRIGRLLHYEF
jgi:O-methyltransferase involved in polyketide biosynthesis